MLGISQNIVRFFGRMPPKDGYFIYFSHSTVGQKLLPFFRPMRELPAIEVMLIKKPGLCAWL